MSIGVYIDPPSASLLADRFFERATGRNESSLARCLAFVKHRLEAQGIPMHTSDRMPAPAGSDTHLYVSTDVVLSAFMVTESPVVEPRIFRALERAKHHVKRIFSCLDQAEIAPFASTA